MLDCTVQNTGDRWSAKEVMQLYATCPCALQPKEYRRLVAFAKTGLLAPGQKQTLALEFSPDALASFDPQAGGWVLDAKTYGLWLGNSLQSCRLIGGIQLEQREVLEQVSLCWPDAPQDWFSPGMKHCLEKRRSLEKELLQQGLPILPVRPGLLLGSARSRPHPDPNAEKALAIASQLDDDSLVRLCVGQWHKDNESQLGSAGVSVPGSAGETQEIGGDIRVPSLVLADGPAGLRLASCYLTQKGQPLIPPLEQCFENGFLARGEYNPGGTRHYQYCTAFPIGTMLAQSWNTCLLQEVGAAMGYEMALFGVSLWLAPGMNIHRSPLCGRNFEYFSEDPLLSGQMAAAITRGVQSCPGCGVTLKHFACNNQETERLESNSLVSERALREIYLRGFQIAVQSAQPSAIMTSYNPVNGVHAANSAALCTAIARCEWGFAGIFMTDWDTTSSRRCTAGCCAAVPGGSSKRRWGSPPPQRPDQTTRAAITYKEVFTTMDTEKLRSWQSWIRTELESSVNFWLKNGMDPEHGGIYTCLTREGKVFSTDKSVWMQGRCGWIFAHMCRLYGTRPEWLEASRSCLDFMEDHCINRSAGNRMYFTVTADGKPLRQRRYCFSEEFYAIANAEYYGITGDRKCLERARRAYQLVYDLNHGAPDPTGLGPKTIPETRKGRALADPMIFLNMTSVLRRVDPEQAALYDQYSAQCVHDIFAYHHKPDLHCTLESVGMNGEFQSDISAGRVVNPGHDIECSWFLMEEANRIGSRDLHRKAEDVFRFAINAGWDQEYGGLLYFIDCMGLPPEAYEHDMKLWWPHNEILIASLMAYRDTRDETYLDWFYKTIAYCRDHFADPAYGEWYGYLRRDGKPTLPACKGSTFKGPFHVPRSLSMADKLIDEILAP